MELLVDDEEGVQNNPTISNANIDFPTFNPQLI